MWRVSERRLIPAVSIGGNGEKDKKKNQQKWKVDHFGIFFLKEVRLKIFFDNKVERKKKWLKAPTLLIP